MLAELHRSASCSDHQHLATDCLVVDIHTNDCIRPRGLGCCHHFLDRGLAALAQLFLVLPGPAANDVAETGGDVLEHVDAEDRLARDDAEEDPSYKQIIPYAIFRHGDRFLHYVRGGGSGEKRLAAKGSIGIGGHINQEDFDAQAHLDKDTYTIGVEREIDEELNIVGQHSQRIVGLINDDSNPVGQVHLGVIHLFDLETDQVTSNEDNITELEFLTLEELRARRDRLETWSQCCLDGLDRIEA